VAHKVVFRDEANAELTALYDYIADESGPAVAIAYVRRIRGRVHGAGTFSRAWYQAGRYHQRPAYDRFRTQVTIAFRVFRTHVEIVTIAYGGRNFEIELQRKG
jgi:toxin ParE1/3/4